MRQSLYILNILGIILVLGCVKALAQGPPIFTDTPIMLGLEGRGIRTFANIVSKENVTIYVQPFAFPFNITNKWQVGAIVPFISVSPKSISARSGLGDIKLFTKYQLYQKDGLGKTLRSLVKVTLTFPSGNTNESPPLGTGTTQTTVSLVNGYITTRYGVYGEMGYNIAGNELQNSFIYNLAIGLPLLPQKYPPMQINLFLEINGRYIGDSGNNLFLSPGIQFIPGKKILFESGIQLPLVESADMGQKTKFVLRIGIRVLLF